MPEARYRPLSDLTPVEREVERMRDQERARKRRSGRRGYTGQGDGVIGPQTRREIEGRDLPASVAAGPMRRKSRS